ncbi:hypothetical protein TVAG_171030 [Trichomonas vaginalis G3]|uniref:Uncharacterized protein n=1 Tax=Trichomonas vaginalis (strain ATCC PRA-98 / G3) TaxID=412133 RepID=A2FIP3_TRIV3|nr:armadillo (ARM) repeat-containing protein family [Trichomonas vaginalis G3]EAX95215.1 hypothetical protein TVAG_171030 [Trichomonas vaginalis G3]KAI5506070.1 armadillo (ARM) repeat-containing protein family [Trichomonas vaginalis G3]|eukprot:XP_001308145.1 hypothetical protein [Trichomonas vaginalis G3]
MSKRNLTRAYKNILYQYNNSSSRETFQIYQDVKSRQEIYEIIKKSIVTEESINDVLNYCLHLETKENIGASNYMFSAAFTYDDPQLSDWAQQYIIKMAELYSFNSHDMANAESFELLITFMKGNDTKSFASIVVMSAILEDTKSRTFLSEESANQIFEFCQRDVANSGLLYALIADCDDIPVEFYKSVLPYAEHLVEYHDTSISLVGIEFLIQILKHDVPIDESYLSKVIREYYNCNDMVIYRCLLKLLTYFKSFENEFTDFVLFFISPEISDLTLLSLSVLKKFQGHWPDDVVQHVENTFSEIFDNLPFRVADEALSYFAYEKEYRSLSTYSIFRKLQEFMVHSNYGELFLTKMCEITEESNVSGEYCSEIAQCIEENIEEFAEMSERDQTMNDLCERIIDFASNRT